MTEWQQSTCKEKRKDRTGEKQLTKVTARVGLVLDITGSMRTLYKNGTVQNVVERILAVADQFDDNGSLDVWVYDNEFSRLKPVSEKDFSGYVDREILNNDRLHKFGRNDEPPVMIDVFAQICCGGTEFISRFHRFYQ